MSDENDGSVFFIVWCRIKYHNRLLIKCVHLCFYGEGILTYQTNIKIDWCFEKHM